MNKKGFTLVELLVVIVILGLIMIVVATTAFPAMKKAKVNTLETYASRLVEKAKEKCIAENCSDGTEYTVKDLMGENAEKQYIGTLVMSDTGKDYKVSGTVKTKDNKYVVQLIDSNISVEDSVYTCIRATELHKEECTNTSNGCYSVGYTKEGTKGTTTIEYGKLKEPGSVLESGDAFDCDVDGNGTYDADERFYYVSDLESNNNYAVLIYYNNVSKDSNGIVQVDNTENSKIDYYASASENWHGPVTAITNLPTTGDWKNVSLSSTSRTITNETGGTTTNNGSNNILNPFSYEGYAARLLTYQEVATACGGDKNPTSTGGLDNCNYLLENTYYSSTTNIQGYLLETPSQDDNDTAFAARGGWRFASGYVVTLSGFGVRPVIEVPKTQIEK